MEGNGQEYNVQMVGLAKSQLKQHYFEAAAAGTGQRLSAALRQIVSRLQKDPLNFGEPLYRLPTLNLQVRKGAIAPVAGFYGVHNEKPLVWINGFKMLS